jgi:hypothetical protein
MLHGFAGVDGKARKTKGLHCNMKRNKKATVKSRLIV